jgi:hypothetical protein
VRSIPTSPPTLFPPQSRVGSHPPSAGLCAPMIQDLIDLLDRGWSFLESQQGYAFAAHVFPFFEQLHRDARTQAILDDLRAEETDSLVRLSTARDAARGALLQLLDTSSREHPEAFPAGPDASGYNRSASAIRYRLQPDQQPATPQSDDENEEDEAGETYTEESWIPVERAPASRGLTEAFQALRGILRNLPGQRTDKIDRIERALKHAERARSLFWKTSAASALSRMAERLADLHPDAADSAALVQRMIRHTRTTLGPLKGVSEALFKQEAIPPVIAGDDADSMLVAFRRDARTIYEELRRRLGTERSLRSVVERYRQRCQWYEAAKLRALAAARGPGAAEDRLTETLALYLFEHGLNPLVRPLVGQLLPDVLHPAVANSRFTFYVEAKQYTSSCRSYLRQGARQVWDMLGQLDGTPYAVREAFYVVYRRSGPKYGLPERLHHARWVVFPLMIDIAEPSERGSRANDAITILPQELLPEE